MIISRLAVCAMLTLFRVIRHNAPHLVGTIIPERDSMSDRDLYLYFTCLCARLCRNFFCSGVLLHPNSDSPPTPACMARATFCALVSAIMRSCYSGWNPVGDEVPRPHLQQTAAGQAALRACRRLATPIPLVEQVRDRVIEADRLRPLLLPLHNHFNG